MSSGNVDYTDLKQHQNCPALQFHLSFLKGGCSGRSQLIEYQGRGKSVVLRLLPEKLLSAKLN
jgi:hypothetical protein